jgi:small subunit ribosomal protein S16
VHPVLTRIATCPTPIRWEKTTAVAVKIKLKRMGKIRAPYYRIIIADSRTKRDGRAIEEIGKYHPKAEPSFIEVDSERAQHWLSVGAQPTDPVRKLLEITGDWQKFKSLPGTEGSLKVAEPKADKKAAFAAAAAESLADSGAKPKARGKAADAKAAKAEAAPKAEKAPAKEEKAPAKEKKAAAEPAEAAEAASADTGAADTGAADSGAADAAATAEAKAQAEAEVAVDSAPPAGSDEAEGNGA